MYIVPNRRNWWDYPWDKTWPPFDPWIDPHPWVDDYGFEPWTYPYRPAERPSQPESTNKLVDFVKKVNERVNPWKKVDNKNYALVISANIAGYGPEDIDVTFNKKTSMLIVEAKGENSELRYEYSVKRNLVPTSHTIDKGVITVYFSVTKYRDEYKPEPVPLRKA